MNTMGGACSLQRLRRELKQESEYDSVSMMAEEEEEILSKGNLCRHSIKMELPDESIAALYPIEDNCIIDDDNDNNEGSSRIISTNTKNETAVRTHSPKTLVQLCIDAVCRNLPCIEGDLPAGIPQELVDDILDSLVKHSALNATTLRALRKCELSELTLSRSRGVSDDWLCALNMNNDNGINNNNMGKSSSSSDTEMIVSNSNVHKDVNASVLNSNNHHQDELSVGSSSSSSSSGATSFHSAVSTQRKVAHSGLNESIIGSPSSLLSTYHKLDEPSVTTQLTLLDLRGSQQLTDRGLLQLTDLRCLEVARLDNCYSIIGNGIIALSNSQRLHTLSLSNCRCLTDEAIINISHLSSITALSLDGCRCLTDIALEAISNLYNLQKLELSQCDLITDDGLEHLQSLTYIEELSLGWCRLITDNGIQMLTSQPNRGESLTSLSLARCQITDVGIGYLDKLLALRALDLNGCSHIGSSALGTTLQKLDNLETLDVSYCPHIIRSSWQGKIQSLRSLDLCYSGVKNANLARLSNLPSLEEINLDSCPVGDWSLAHFADNNVVPNLKSLDLADTDVSDRGLIHIAKMKKLEHLSLFYCDISNAGLRYLSEMESLQVLNLDSRDIGDPGMFFLRNLKNLKCLDVFSGRITDNGCCHISMIKSLESLELCGGGVGDFGCHHLSTLENLTSLNLSQNERITNIGASALASLTKLKALNLSNTGVTSEALPFFKGLLDLQSLAMYGCRGIQNSAQMQDLQRDLPNLKCMRLSGSSDGDGTIDEDESEDSEEIDSLVEDEVLSFADESSDGASNISFFEQEDEDNDDEEDSDGDDDDFDNNSDGEDSDEVMQDEI